MEILVRGLDSHYEQEHLARVFYPAAALRRTKSTKGAVVYAALLPCSGRMAVALRREDGRCRVRWGRVNRGEPRREQKLALSRLLYFFLLEETGTRPPWGMLTGVRPVRLLRTLQQQGGQAYAKERLQGFYAVSEEKYRLAQSIARIQQPVLESIGENSYSLYISIPFCPTRCAYCSFVSQSLNRDAALAAPYVDLLCRELEETAALAAGLGLQLASIYIGGGTPASLSAAQMKRLLDKVAACFPVLSLREYSFEAGRPDCTTAEKLALMKAYGISRISINPQSMNDHVLRKIGRNHSAADVERCFAQARAAGHGNINMDIIAGLPGESTEEFCRSLGRVLALGPENITLHTLTLKRASNLVMEKAGHRASPADMLSYAYETFAKEGLVPYYLYRQKNTAGNFENTGWCRPGTESFYNIAIMEEAQTILSAGAGGTTKLVAPASHKGTAKIRRFFHCKYPLEYLQNFERDLAAKRKGVLDFYAGNLDTEKAGGD